MTEVRPVNNTSNYEDELADDEIELFNGDEQLVWETIVWGPRPRNPTLV